MKFQFKFHIAMNISHLYYIKSAGFGIHLNMCVRGVSIFWGTERNILCLLVYVHVYKV